MTTTYVSVQLQVNGQPYTFAVNATDGSDTEVVNLVSGLGIGDTFSGGATISYVSNPILEADSGSILGMVLTDPQNNVVMQIPLVNAELQVPGGYPVSCPVGLNYTLGVTTTNTVT